MGVAQSMAEYTMRNLKPESTYFTRLVSKDLRDLADNAILDQLKDVYSRASKVLDVKGTKEYELTVTCDNATDSCTRDYYASMSDSRKTLNLCDKFFKAKDDGEDLKTSEVILTTCKKDGYGGLVLLRDFSLSKGTRICTTRSRYVTCWFHILTAEHR